MSFDIRKCSKEVFIQIVKESKNKPEMCQKYDLSYAQLDHIFRKFDLKWSDIHVWKSNGGRERVQDDVLELAINTLGPQYQSGADIEYLRRKMKNVFDVHYNSTKVLRDIFNRRGFYRRQIKSMNVSIAETTHNGKLLKTFCEKYNIKSVYTYLYVLSIDVLLQIKQQCESDDAITSAITELRAIAATNCDECFFSDDAKDLALLYERERLDLEHCAIAEFVHMDIDTGTYTSKVKKQDWSSDWQQNAILKDINKEELQELKNPLHKTNIVEIADDEIDAMIRESEGMMSQD